MDLKTIRVWDLAVFLVRLQLALIVAAAPVLLLVFVMAILSGR